jgi:hypothetical protein
VMEDKSLEMIEEINCYSCLSFQCTFGKWLRIWIVVITQHPMHFGEGKQEMVGKKRQFSSREIEERKVKGDIYINNKKEEGMLVLVGQCRTMKRLFSHGI